MDIIITNKGVLTQSELKVLQFESDHSVYEVVRIIDGVALFLEDHFSRLITSTRIGGLRFEMEFSEFRQKIDELVILNEKLAGNVKFVLSEIENEIQWSFSFIPHNYPDINDYRHGVSTGLLFAERENPNAKIVQNTIRKRATQMIADHKLFEVLLVDRNGMITEGSRSNVFFVKENRFYTAPDSKECLNELAFPIIEESVLASEISAFDAVFLTGTSPNVLPVNCIGTVHFAANNFFVEQLMVKYNSMIARHINDRKNS
jgi:branched-chain amino acid aminotransferase